MSVKAVNDEILKLLIKGNPKLHATVFKGEREVDVYVAEDATYVSEEDFPEYARCSG